MSRNVETQRRIARRGFEWDARQATVLMPLPVFVETELVLTAVVFVAD